MCVDDLKAAGVALAKACPGAQCGPNKGDNVAAWYVPSCEGNVEVQFVRCDFFEERAKKANKKVVDLDVNNLKISSDGIEKRVPEEGDAKEAIIQRIQQKKFKCIKPAKEIKDRVKKMKARGWQKA